MHGRFTLLLCALVLGVMTMAAAPSVGSAEGGAHSGSAEGGAQLEECQGTKALSETTGTHPSPTGHSCWVEVQPYPFGAEGEAVNPSKCATGEKGAVEKCYLEVTSMAFRAWNRGLAVTERTFGSEPPFNPDGVWAFNGANWSPVPGFLGKEACPGGTVVWAGKLDYWVIGGEHTTGTWPNLCRFDGVHLAWQSLEIPQATKEHAADGHKLNGKLNLRKGAINSAACFAWNNCWFFGSYGTVVHWNGKALSDASPDPSQTLLQGEYNAAVAREGSAGEAFGLAVGSTSENPEPETPPLQTRGSGAPPAQLYGSSGGSFTPLAFTPFTLSLRGDSYRTDLVAVDLGAAGQGWVAGNPTQREEPHGNPQPAPLEPVSTSGAASACAGPPEDSFTYASRPGSAAFEWSSIAVIPTTGEAFAGGKMRPEKAGEGANEDAAHFEPVIARVNCRETTTTTRFRIENPTRSPGLEAPADREGGQPKHEGRVTAIAANATNDAWAATGEGTLVEPPPLNPTLSASEYYEPPHLYRLTNGRPPAAPAEEAIPQELRRLKEEAEGQEEGPLPPEEVPPQPPAPESPVTETSTHAIRLPAAVYDVKARLHTTNGHGHLNLSLYLTFKLRRPTTIGAQALRHGHVVSVAKPRHFAGHSGLLILSLDRKRWPTNVKFVS